MRKRQGRLAFLALLVLLSSCVKAPTDGPPISATGEAGNADGPQQEGQPPETAGEVARYSGPTQFTDVTTAARINFRHNSGAYGKKYLPETMGSGCAFLDYDNDGWQDILLINSMDWPDRKRSRSYPALYHNDRDGTFTDVTKEAGLMVEMYGLGCAIADYDNDGNVDIYMTCLGPNYLFRNLGGGRFADVTARARANDPGFSTSAAWLDYDKDGNLDLYICNYVEWSIEKDLYCTLDGTNKSYCDPKSYKGQSPTLYRNKGDGTFDNVTAGAGLLDPACKSLGVALTDYDNDGWTDLLVANDTQPNKLYRNNGNGTFTDAAMTAGVAFSEAGVARAGMGVDAADYDGTGRQSFIIGNFSNEMMALYHNEGNGLFIDDAPTSTIGQASLLTLTFACFFFDYDLDGLLDVFGANGHVMDDINKVQPKVTYAEPPHLFRNLGQNGFEEVTSRLGRDFAKPVVARGAAHADIDNDGDLDLLISTNNGTARLLRNDGGNQNNVIRVQTVGTRSNRDGIGAKVTVKLAGGSTRSYLVKTGSSYCSQNEVVLTFGLEKADKVDKMDILWPSGALDTLSAVNANQLVTVQEGKGIASSRPLAMTSGDDDDDGGG